MSKLVVKPLSSDSVVYTLPKACTTVFFWVSASTFPFLYKVEYDGKIEYEEELSLVGGLPRVGVFKDDKILGKVVKICLYNNDKEKDSLSYLSLLMQVTSSSPGFSFQRRDF